MSNKLVLKNNSLVLYKTNNDFFIRAIVRIFSFGERLIVPFNGTINLSPHENILTIALINIHYLYNSQRSYILCHVLFLNYIICIVLNKITQLLIKTSLSKSCNSCTLDIL